MSIARKLLYTYSQIRKKLNPLHLPTNADLYKNVHMWDFDNWVNSFDHKSDPLQGLIDYTADPDKFNEEVYYGRDCDDFARQWSLWALYNKYDAVECIVLNPTNPFHTAHIITIVKTQDSYWLMNYHPYGRFKTFEESIHKMKDFESYKDDMIYVISDQFSKEILYGDYNR